MPTTTKVLLCLLCLSISLSAQATGTIYQNVPNAPNHNDPANTAGSLPRANFTTNAINYLTADSTTTSAATFLGNPTFTGTANGFNPALTSNNSEIVITGQIFLNSGANSSTVVHDDGATISITGILPNPIINTAIGTDNFTITNPGAAGFFTYTVLYAECCAGPAQLSWTVNGQVVGATPPNFTKSFSPTRIAPGQTSVLAFTVTNTNTSTALTGIGFSDTLPAILKVATPNGLTGSCGGGVISAVAGSGLISLTGATLAGAASCTFSVNVVGNAEGTANNSTSAIGSSAGNGPVASATLLVVSPPLITKSFSEVGIGVGQTVTVTFTLNNPNTATTLTGVAFTDALPAGLQVATPNGLSGTCGGGTITAVAGAGSIALANATLPAGASCTFSVNVTSNGAAIGLLTNSTGTVTSNQAAPGAAATATLFVGDPYQVSYFPNLNLGDSVINITNAGTLGAGLSSGTSAATVGALCANVYAFSPDEQLIACCSCPVTPSGLVSLSARADLISNTLTPGVPTSIVVKLLATVPVGGSCTNSAAAGANGPLALANGMLAWGTKLHQISEATPSAFVTERPFRGVTLSAGELNRLQNLCSFIIANGSGFGICRSCRLGGLGASGH